MENDLKKFIYITFIATSILFSSISLAKGYEKQNYEVDRLNQLLNDQYGRQMADLDFAERQAGQYHACTFLFNICPAATLAAGEKYTKSGFIGSTSPWWWAALAGKLVVVAAFFGVLLWLPWHLDARYTKPMRAKAEDAKDLLSKFEEKVKEANRKRTQSLQQASAAKRESELLAATVLAEQKNLLNIQNAVVMAKSELKMTQSKLAETQRLRGDFERFL